MASGLSFDSLLEQSVGNLFAYALGGAVTPVLAPLTQELTNQAWPKLPVMPVDASVAAALSVLGRVDDNTAATWAAQSGFGTEQYTALKNAAITALPLDLLITLFLRGKISADDFGVGLQRLGYDPDYVSLIPDLAVNYLSPAEAAQARQQGFLSQDQQHYYAALGGIGSDDAELQYEISGLPPGVTEGLELLRRGLIDETRFAEYVYEGNTKPKFLPDLLNLVDVPLSASLAVEAALRQRIPQEQAQQIAALSGMSADSFAIALETTGRAMGIEQALTLVNRGVYTKQDFQEVVARSDVRVEYTDALYNLRVKYPSEFQIVRAVTAGTISDDLARQGLEYDGYTSEWIDALIKGAHSTKTTATKHVAAGTIEVLYQAGLEDHPTAVEQLKVLGYDDTEAAEYLEVWTARRYVSELVHGVTMVRTRFTDWKISETEARDVLGTLGIDPATISKLLVWWSSERTANAPVLTVAQIAGGLYYGRYSYAQASQLLMQRGYSEDDALTVLWDRMHGDPRGKG